MIRFASLLLLSQVVSADVLDSTPWEWLPNEQYIEETMRDGYDEPADGLPPIPSNAERATYCEFHRDAAQDMLNYLWQAENLATNTGLPLRTYAEAVGEQYIKYRWYQRCRAYHTQQAAEGSE